MITIVFNNSNVTLYRIPINGNQTKVFTLPHRADSQSLQILIDLFNHTNNNPTTASNVTTSMLPAITECYTSMVLFIISAFLTVIFFILIILSMFYIYQRRYHRNYQLNQTSLHVIDHIRKLFNLQTNSSIKNSNTRRENKEMVYYMNLDYYTDWNNDAPTPYQLTTVPYTSKQFL